MPGAPSFNYKDRNFRLGKRAGCVFPRVIAFKCMTTQGAPPEPVSTVDFFYKQETPLESESQNFIFY